jgi:2-phosphosulfolactate phosphatase
VRVKVGFTPGEEVAASVGIVIDVLRATSTICQAIAVGYESVTCVGEVDDGHALAAEGVALAGERHNVRIEGFDFGNSPREFAGGEHPASKLVLTTTNGTRLLLAAAGRCETVIVASLLNLNAVIEATRDADDVAVLCAGVEGNFAIDDAYVAGRIAAALGGEPDDAAIAAIRLAGTFSSAEDGIGAGISAENIRQAGLDDDIPWCARESVLNIVPQIVQRSPLSVVIAA